MVKPGSTKSTKTDFDMELDARGWDCPLPVIHTIRALNRLNPGQILRVVATAPGSMVDIPAYVNQSENTLLESVETTGEFHYLIKKG